MMTKGLTSRRSFLAASGAALIAAGSSTAAPIKVRSSRIGVTTVSLRDRIPFRLPGAAQPARGELDLHGAPRFVADVLGLKKLEVWNLQFDDTSDVYCAALRDAARRCGVRITNVQLDGKLDLGAVAAPDRAMAVADARAWIDRAALIGASSLRANLSALAPKAPFDVAPVAESFSELADYAAQKKIMLLTENHFGHSVAIENVIALLEAVDSPNLRTVFDWGNVPSPSTSTVIDALERLAPWLYLVSAKGVNFDSDYKAADYDVTAIVKATEALGYRGDYSIELFGPTPPGFDAVKAIGAMRTAVEAGLQSA